MGSCSLCRAWAASLRARARSGATAPSTLGSGGSGRARGGAGGVRSRHTRCRVNQPGSMTVPSERPSTDWVSTGRPSSHPWPYCTPRESRVSSSRWVSTPSAMSRAPMCPLKESSETSRPRRARCEFDRVNEGPVDLDELRPELGDDLHAGVPGAGVVHGDAVAGGAELGGDPLQTREVGHRVSLAELEDDRRRVQPGVVDGVLQGAEPLSLVEQGSDQHVDEDVHGAEARHAVERGPQAGEVDRLLHVQRRSRGEQLVGGGEEGAGGEAGERLVADDRVVDEPHHRLERGRDPPVLDQGGELGPQPGVRAPGRADVETPGGGRSLGLPDRREHRRGRLQGGHQVVQGLHAPGMDGGDDLVVDHRRNSRDLDPGGQAGKGRGRPAVGGQGSQSSRCRSPVRCMPGAAAPDGSSRGTGRWGCAGPPGRRRRGARAECRRGARGRPRPPAPGRPRRCTPQRRRPDGRGSAPSRWPPSGGWWPRGAGDRGA